MKYDQEARTLEQVCQEDSATGGFSIELVGNVYCSLALGRKVDCPYLAEIQDKNALYPCTRPEYISMLLDHESYKVEH